MYVWMIHARRKSWPNDDTLEGPFVSKEYIFNDSVWNDLSWHKREDNSVEQYHAEMSDWHLCLYRIKVEGS